jgi:SAM-dependent methyltransferase
MADHDLRCRSCGHGGLEFILSLGRTPLANRLLRDHQLKEWEPRYPLDLYFCGTCSLVQIGEVILPEALFSEYAYFSSFADTTLVRARELVARLIVERSLGRDSLVMELASNDGYLLQYYQEHGVPVLGVEPAENIARHAQERGIRTLCEFFGSKLAARLAMGGSRCDVLHANNVLAHVPDLNGFVAGICQVLKPHGIAVIEVPYVVDLIERVEFDTIYHEHLFYFSLTALMRLFSRNGLAITDVERIEAHGGSLRLYLQRIDGVLSPKLLPFAVSALIEQEDRAGVLRFKYFENFGKRVEELKTELIRLLGGLKADNCRVAAYGASAKGATLLNYCEIGRETLEYVVDRSTAKQGLFTPGTHLPILSPEALLETLPEYVLLLTWNFAEEILQQQVSYREAGGRFILPVPAPQIII